MKFQINGNGKSAFSITKPCHGQIAEKLDIPLKYYHKMEEETPELLAQNVNTWLERSEKEYFVRGMGDSVPSVSQRSVPGNRPSGHSFLRFERASGS
ncbi:MAG: hypothetical protein AB1410_07920 [Acidobacteriota bacterium]